MASQPPVCTKTFKLNNGTEFPAVGLGTWQGVPGAEGSETRPEEQTLVASIVHALQNGYRLIDTAQSYGSEAAVGQAVRASGVPRSEITIVTKFGAALHGDPAEALRISIQALGLDYIDVFLMHWPWAVSPEGKPLRIHESPTFVETWKRMEPLVGPQCRAIGVSNFAQKTLDALLKSATVVPAVNQIELHALYPNRKLVPYCQSKGIHVMSWRTVGVIGLDGNNIVQTNPLFTDIAKAHGCSPAVVNLSWAVQRGVTVIPKSTKKSRIEENIRLVTLTDEEMAKVNSAPETIGKYRMADNIPVLQVEIDGEKTLMGWSTVDFGWDDEEGNWLT